MTARFAKRFLRKAHPLQGVAFMVALLMLSQHADAREFELQGADLRVLGDTTWAGGGWGGYHPIRLEITNFGPGRDLELRFAPHERGEAVPTVRRRLRVEQNATARVAISVPLVGGRNSGRFEVLVGGVGVESLSQDVNLLSPADGETPRPSLVVISSDEVDVRGFEAAMLADAYSWIDSAYPPGHFMARGLAGGGEMRHAVVDPAVLPSSWIDYTATDLVAIRLDALVALRPDERVALIDWVAAGGRLIVHDVGATPAESEELSRVLGMAATRGPRDEWRPAADLGRRPLSIVLPADGGSMPSEGSPLPSSLGIPPEVARRVFEQFGGLLGQAPEREAARLTLPTWPHDPAPFSVRRVGFGRVAAVSETLSGASGADWAWLIRELGGPAIAWPIRNGLTSGGGDLEFINLPILGVQGVPTIAFLTLITLFTLAIGPINYFLLWRRKQLSRLVVTVPTLAIGTSVLLFGYTAVAHGFATKGRVRSVTLLDPATNSATSVSRLSLFSGLAPSTGLRFSNATAVFPMYPFEQGFVDGEVDWTETQALAAGWLKTRTRTQFVTVSRRDERGRLTVAPTAGGLRVSNGLAVPLKFLAMTGPDGTLYFGRDLAAGGEAVLKRLADEDWSLVRTHALDLLPEPPEGVEPLELAAGFGGMSWIWQQQGWKPQFRTGLLERHLARLTGPSPVALDPSFDREGWTAGDEASNRVDLAVKADTLDPLASPHGFLAVAGENPGIDLGGLEVDERGSLHVLMGRW